MFRRWGILVAALALLAGLGMAAGPARGTTPQPRIAYLAYTCTGPTAPCHDSVNVVNQDGSGLTTLKTYTLAPTQALGEPAWSPHGSALAWMAPSSSGSGWDEVVAAPDGSAIKTIASYSPAGQLLSWSPDGARLAVATSSGLVITNPDGTGATTIPGVTTEPAWSPDGSQIAYWAGSDYSIDSVHPDGTGTRTLLSGAAIKAAGGCGQGLSFITWSPDGVHLAFVDQCASQDGESISYQLFGADVATGSVLKLGNEDSDVRPAWSPDGSALAYGGVTVTGSSTPTASGGTTPSWAPDGARISYIKSGLLHTVSPDGSNDTTLVSTAGASADDVFSPSPLAQRDLGVLRTDTAVDVARNAWSSAPAVVIARDDTYPDALAASPVAAKLGGPLLLTDPANLPAPVCAEIVRLGAHTAYIMGDTTAVSAGVESQLKTCGITSISRLEGPTRFDTAASAASYVGGKAVYVTEGADPDPTKGWPDAVSVSGLAASQGRPILLVTQNSLPEPTKAALQSLGATSATIVGGTASVSDSVASQIQSMGITVTRIAGADRYATSADVASASTQAGLSAGHVWLAIGNNWPDALAAGPAAAHDGGVLLLVDGTSMDNSSASKSWLSAQGTNISVIRVVGGPDVLSPSDEVQAIRLTGG